MLPLLREDGLAVPIFVCTPTVHFCEIVRHPFLVLGQREVVERVPHRAGAAGVGPSARVAQEHVPLLRGVVGLFRVSSTPSP